MPGADFWDALDHLVAGSTVVIDRPRGSRHPRYPEMVYPVDYGYLQDTTAMDGGGIDVWRGSDPGIGIDAVACIVDLLKRDAEIKILIGCTEAEKQAIYRLHNESEYMKGVLIHRSRSTLG